MRIVIDGSRGQAAHVRLGSVAIRFDFSFRHLSVIYCFPVFFATPPPGETIEIIALFAGQWRSLAVRRVSLCVRRSDAAETLYPSRVHGLRTIILAGRAGASFTSEAIRWTVREGVGLYLMCLSGEAFSIIGETTETDHRRAALAYTPASIQGCQRSAQAVGRGPQNCRREVADAWIASGRLVDA